MPATKPIQVVILGGGFGGLATARELERLLPDSSEVRITVVNRENYFLFTPMRSQAISN